MSSQAPARDLDGMRPWEWLLGCASLMTATDRHNYSIFTAWFVGWAVTFLACTIVVDGGVVPAGAASWLVAMAPNILAIATVLAYVRFLRDSDELMGRIQLEGLALGFGVGLFFAMGYRLLERAGAPDLDINDIATPMLVGWVVGQLIALRRYR
jgi:hypothetical protein